MGASFTTQASDNKLAINGELTFATVTDLWQQSQLLFHKSQAPIQLELANVTQSDSSGVALLVAWVKQLKQQNREIILLHPPEQMLAIVRVSGLSHLLPFVLQ